MNELDNIIVRGLESFSKSRKLYKPMGELDSLPYMPILWFGDMEAYMNSPHKIVTLSINPSWQEFYGRNGQYQDRFDLDIVDRIHGISTEQATNWESIILEYKDSLNSYFERKPYNRWFCGYRRILEALDASYYSQPQVSNRVLHIDLFSPVPTLPTWGNLDQGKKQALISLWGDIFLKFLDYLNPDLILTSVGKCNFQNEMRISHVVGELWRGKLFQKYVCFQRKGMRGKPQFSEEEIEKVKEEFSHRRV